MFNTESIEPWAPGEREEFERCVTERQRQVNRAALQAAAIFLLTTATIVPFSKPFPWNRYWAFAKYLVWLDEGALLWLLLKLGSVYASWQAARETRRETPGA